jgi:hypothetical protein
MNRLAFFLAAMKAELYRKRAWVFSAFTMIQEGPDDWRKDPYAYRIVQTPSGHFFVDPNNGLKLTPLDDAPIGQAPFFIKDRIQLKAGDVINLSKSVETNYGNLLANCITLVYPFGNKIPYITGRFMPSDLESLILPRLQDTPASNVERNPKWIYVDEYLKFADAMFFIDEFASMCVPAATEKSLTQAPGTIELRNELVNQYKDRLHTGEVGAIIAKKLQEHDRKWLGDDDSTNFMISKKSYEVVRSKKFLMLGAEAGLSDGVNIDLIQKSLIEGWDVNKFPSMNNILRAGSYNRGHQTMLGGESVKWLLRASSNINITVDDCGTNLGRRIYLNDANSKRYLNFTINGVDGPIKLTDEVLPTYLNSWVLVRSPMYCWLDKTDICKCCAGPRLAENPTGASSAISDYGSTMMLLYMKAAHGKALTLARMNYKEALF